MTCIIFFFFFNDTATTEIYTLSLHDALPISEQRSISASAVLVGSPLRYGRSLVMASKVSATATTRASTGTRSPARSEEHTSELQSRQYLVCRLLLEKKNKKSVSLNDSHFLTQ